MALKQESIRHATAIEEVDHEPGRTWAAATGSKRACMDDEYDDYDYPSYSPVRQLHGGRHRSSPTSRQPRNGWGRVVFNVVGEVAGRVWQFCRVGAFRGFYAGGGQGYAMPGYERDENQGSDVKDMTSGDVTITPRASPQPNDNDDDRGLGGSYVNVEASTPPRPAKRIQREKGRGEPRGEHWIIVPSPEKTPNDRRTRSNNRASEVGIGHHRRGGGRGLGTSAASRAGRRSGFSTATGIPKPSSPMRASQRPASYASPRGPPSPTKDELGPGLDSPETRRLMAQHQRIERAKDASMSEFNRRLKAMIQEGKEALGTTFTVEEVEMDGVEDGGTVMDETDEDDGLEDI